MISNRSGSLVSGVRARFVHLDVCPFESQHRAGCSIARIVSAGASRLSLVGWLGFLEPMAIGNAETIQPERRSQPSQSLSYEPVGTSLKPMHLARRGAPRGCDTEL